MFRFRYFKKFILSSSAAVFGAGSDNLEQGDSGSNLEQGDSGSNSGQGDSGSKKRPSDLPIYGDPKENTEEQTQEETKIEKQIGKIREEVWIWYDHVKGYREKVVEVVVTGKEHSEGLLRSLRNEELPVPRSGAIAISGLAGVILGLRGGWFKRIVYGTTGAGIMAAICYPKETKEMTQEALATSKKYVLISYNFIYGVKPDNLKLPSPSDLLGSTFKTTEKEKDDRPSDKTVSGNLTKETPPRQNDQSDPADKDLYTNRK